MDYSDKDNEKFRAMFLEMMTIHKNPFYHFYFFQGEIEVGKKVHIGMISEIDERSLQIFFGDNCDVASFVAINVANFYKICIVMIEKNEERLKIITQNIFTGIHFFINKVMTKNLHLLQSIFSNRNYRKGVTIEL